MQNGLDRTIPLIKTQGNDFCIWENEFCVEMHKEKTWAACANTDRTVQASARDWLGNRIFLP